MYFPKRLFRNHLNIRLEIPENSAEKMPDTEPKKRGRRKKVVATDAEDATAAIKEVLEEPAWKKLKPSDIRPPRFFDPKKAGKQRLCPCGSGKYYRHCHAKW